jgi:hypothetical protein
MNVQLPDAGMAMLLGMRSITHLLGCVMLSGPHTSTAERPLSNNQRPATVHACKFGKFTITAAACTQQLGGPTPRPYTANSPTKA